MRGCRTYGCSCSVKEPQKTAPYRSSFPLKYDRRIIPYFVKESKEKKSREFKRIIEILRENKRYSAIQIQNYRLVIIDKNIILYLDKFNSFDVLLPQSGSNIVFDRLNLNINLGYVVTRINIYFTYFIVR